MLGEISGLTEVAIYPLCALHSEGLWSFASLIPASMSAGRWATQLTQKQLKYIKSRHPGELCMYAAVMNK